MDPIPVQLLRNFNREFPQAWRDIAKYRDERGKSLPWWPDWCFCPTAASLEVVTQHAHRSGQVLVQVYADFHPAVMTALAAWRVTKSIYIGSIQLYSKKWPAWRWKVIYLQRSFTLFLNGVFL